MVQEQFTDGDNRTADLVCRKMDPPMLHPQEVLTLFARVGFWTSWYLWRPDARDHVPQTWSVVSRAHDFDSGNLVVLDHQVVHRNLGARIDRAAPD
jgi:hypothetical protein